MPRKAHGEVTGRRGGAGPLAGGSSLWHSMAGFRWGLWVAVGTNEQGHWSGWFRRPARLPRGRGATGAAAHLVTQKG